MRILTCLGDATSIQTWSNTPYFFLEAGKRAAFLDAGWQLDPEQLRLQRLAWNAWRKIRHGEHGGFQYSQVFLRQLMTQAHPVSPDVEVISHFPLFPPLDSQIRRTSYYIDATLEQNFKDYGLGGNGGVGDGVVAEAIAREAEHYAGAERVLCMNLWAAKSVIDRYGTSPHKVHVVPPGSNLSPAAFDAGVDVSRMPFTPVRLGFVGKDWKRKNLEFVLAVADELQARQVAVEVVAAGFAPEEGPRHPSMQAVGFIDKHREMGRLASFFRRCHFTLLFSTAEAAAMAARESLSLGVPVLARDIGGIPDTVPEGCGHLFAREASPGDVADVVEAYVRDPERYWQLRKDVLARGHEFTWDAAVEKMQAIWKGSDAYSCAHAETVHA